VNLRLDSRSTSNLGLSRMLDCVAVAFWLLVLPARSLGAAARLEEYGALGVEELEYVGRVAIPF
jgi:hypothetical protein